MVATVFQSTHYVGLWLRNILSLQSDIFHWFFHQNHQALCRKEQKPTDRKFINNTKVRFKDDPIIQFFFVTFLYPKTI